jgi:hypothetical protein
MWDEILDAMSPELTVLVEAGRVEELQAQVDAAGLPARVTVKASPYVPPGQVLLVNHTESRRVLREAALWPSQGGDR